MHEKFNLHNHASYFFFFIMFFNINNHVKSEIQSFNIVSDPRPFILFEDFGFSNLGHISISISSISITTHTIINPTESSLMGCFYAPEPVQQTLKLALSNDICIIGKPFVFPILTFNERIVLSSSSVNKTIPVTIPDLYFIFFANCAKNASISMNVDLVTYNRNPSGDPDYIDEHMTSLPSTLHTFSLLFLIFLLAWLYICNKNKNFLQKIHILMGFLLFLRLLELLCYAETQRLIRVTGSPHGWNILWLAIYFLRNMLFISVIMLAGAGWSLSSPCLQECHKYIMAMAISLQFLASTCYVLIRGLGPSYKHYKHWTITYYSLDFICCVTMALPVLKSIDNHVVNSKTEGKEVRRTAQLRVYGNYALALFVYLGFTRLGMLILRGFISYKFWCGTIALELAIEFLFYVVVYLMFRPNERNNDYVVLGDRGEEEIGFDTSHCSKNGF